MARSRKKTANGISKLIIIHRSSGKSIWNNAKSLNLFHFTVQYMIKRSKGENRTENKVRTRFAV